MFRGSRGGGVGRGDGLSGRRRGLFSQAETPAEETTQLKEALLAAKQEIAALEARLTELEKK